MDRIDARYTEWMHRTELTHKLGIRGVWGSMGEVGSGASPSIILACIYQTLGSVAAIRTNTHNRLGSWGMQLYDNNKVLPLIDPASTWPRSVSSASFSSTLESSSILRRSSSNWVNRGRLCRRLDLSIDTDYNEFNTRRPVVLVNIISSMVPSYLQTQSLGAPAHPPSSAFAHEDCSNVHSRTTVCVEISLRYLHN